MKRRWLDAEMGLNGMRVGFVAEMGPAIGGFRHDDVQPIPVKPIEKLAVGTAFVSKGDNEVPFEFKIEEGGTLLGHLESQTMAFEGMQIVHLEIYDLVKLFLGHEERLTSQALNSCRK
ncbi:hypothetical protein Tco_1137414 [Tanacetum coccineum]